MMNKTFTSTLMISLLSVIAVAANQPEKINHKQMIAGCPCKDNKKNVKEKERPEKKSFHIIG